MSEEETVDNYFHRFNHDINCLNDQVIETKTYNNCI